MKFKDQVREIHSRLMIKLLVYAIAHLSHFSIAIILNAFFPTNIYDLNITDQQIQTYLNKLFTIQRMYLPF